LQKSRLQEVDAALNAAIQNRTQADTDYKSRFPSELIEIARRVPIKDESLQHGVRMIRAPAEGRVRWLTSLVVGEPVSASQSLLVIVPDQSALEVEALVFNKDIGHLTVGQRAVVKVETYDYTRYGYLEGIVQWIGADAITDPKLGPVYATRIQLQSFETPNMVNGKHGKIVPGMNITADVRVTQRRMIEYFLAPLLRYKEESLRER
jgi:hemolysin D